LRWSSGGETAEPIVGHGSGEPTVDGRALLARVGALPGGTQLLELAARREDVELVGGAVRDLLLGLVPRELDVVVAEDAAGFARELAEGLGALAGQSPDQWLEPSCHERFRTALVSWSEGQVDVATRRSEHYSAPGALPDVDAGTPEQDLRRRDFSVNAIAVALGGPHEGTLRTLPGALDDLAAARLRVLHERSFLDDPTRLLRLARYRVRLGFEPDEHTAALAHEALSGGALATVSGARIGAELRLALAEPDPTRALRALDELGVLSALDPRLHLHERRARRALELLPADGRADLLLLACLLGSIVEASGEDQEQAMRALLDDLQFPAGERDRVLAAALLVPVLPTRLQAAHAPSQLREAVGAGTPEAVSLAGALAEEQGLSDATAAAIRWLSQVRHVRLRITGDDLLAAGVPAGPEIGRRLELALRRKLDGQLADGVDAELSAAVEGP
jgi:tRNA nucleotidyltransferase (CCA-adding enzyme)